MLQTRHLHGIIHFFGYSVSTPYSSRLLRGVLGYTHGRIVYVNNA